MTSELTPLEKIHKAKYCLVWVSALGSSVQITKKEARALYDKYKNSHNPNYRWHLNRIKFSKEYWLYIN